jgi:hypothetical protein
MNPVRTQIHFLPSHRSVLRAFRTGVSLHSHTECSQEELSGLPRHLERMPVISHFLRRELARYRAKTGQPVDFSRAYWRGPLGAQAAHNLEKKQIEHLDLPAIVSLTHPFRWSGRSHSSTPTFTLAYTTWQRRLRRR